MHRQKDKSISRKGDGDTDREREKEKVRDREREGEGEGERERERERAGDREINTQIDGHPGTTRSTGTRTQGHPGTTPIHGHTGTRARATRALLSAGFPTRTRQLNPFMEVFDAAQLKLYL